MEIKYLSNIPIQTLTTDDLLFLTNLQQYEAKCKKEAFILVENAKDESAKIRDDAYNAGINEASVYIEQFLLEFNIKLQNHLDDSIKNIANTLTALGKKIELEHSDEALCKIITHELQKIKHNEKITLTANSNTINKLMDSYNNNEFITFKLDEKLPTQFVIVHTSKYDRIIQLNIAFIEINKLLDEFNQAV